MKNLLALSINGTPIQAPSGIPTEGLSGSGGKIIGWGITLLLSFAALLALAFLMYGGFMWVTSRGDKEKLSSARRTIIYAVIGLLICFLSFFLIGVFGALFNIDLLRLSL
jgi:hypothetical protein